MKYAGRRNRHCTRQSWQDSLHGLNVPGEEAVFLSCRLYKNLTKHTFTNIIAKDYVEFTNSASLQG